MTLNDSQGWAMCGCYFQDGEVKEKCYQHDEKPGDDKLLKKKAPMQKIPLTTVEFEDWYKGADMNLDKIPAFVTKDSGKRQEFSTGMVRDVQEDKARYDLVDPAMLKRWAELMARGAKKYGEENWRLAATEEEYKRFKASAIRHLMQWMNEERDEDHAAAVFFNVAGAEMVRNKLDTLPF